MEQILYRTLIEKNYFKVGTEVDATYKGKDLCGVPIHKFESTFTVNKLLESKVTGDLVFELMSIEDGRNIRVGINAITKIDGMTPERFAENYLIATDGSDIKVEGKRRGRRPKGWIEPEVFVVED